MDSLALLLGSSTRANLIRALSLSGSPVTAYRVGRLYNMNVPKVYREMRKLVTLGLVETSTEGRGVGYRLVDDDLKRLTLRLSPGVISLDLWQSQEARRHRFRAGLAAKPKLPRRFSRGEGPSKPIRRPGELLTLARLGRRGFDSKYRRLGERTFGVV